MRSEQPAEQADQNSAFRSGARDRAQTGDLRLGKATLYQLSYSRTLKEKLF